MIGEFELIDRLSIDVPRVAKELICGIGDDCAVVDAKNGKVWLVTTDALIEGVHFKRQWGSLKELGSKSLAVNISDVAAMGGIPLYYLVSISLPADMSPDDVLKLYDGLKDMASEHGVLLVGGDTTASRSGLFISITVIGEAGKNEYICRSGAKEGDRVYVSGTLGSAPMGLACLRQTMRDYSKVDQFIKKFKLPTPRVKLGRCLAQTGAVSSMIDISDGLIGDLNHIAEMSRVGYALHYDDIPVEKGVGRVAREFLIDEKSLVLSGGEEYELLFTVKGDMCEEFVSRARREGWAGEVSCIGEILKESSGRKVLDKKGKEIPLAKMGFDHFSAF